MERKEPPPSKHRCCLGLLYYSQKRFDERRPPVCAGLNRKLKQADPSLQLPSDSVPGGDFKYICMGYSAYDEEGLKQAAKKRSNLTDPVQLPYCEGLEVLSAAAMSRKPELLTDGPELSSSSGAGAAAQQPEQPTRQRPGRTFVPGAMGSGSQVPENMDWDRFKERFSRISHRMVDKMQSNLNFMVQTTKRSWEQIMKEISGGGGSGSSSSSGGGGVGR